MHFNRKQRIGGRMAILATVMLLIGVLGGGAWMMRDSISALFRMAPEPVRVEGKVAALSLSPWDAVSGFAAQKEEAAQKAYLDAFVSYAQEHGMNSVVVQLLSEGGQEAMLFGRDRAFKTMENVSATDKLFHQFDPMKYVSEAAQAKGLAVFGVVSPVEGLPKVKEVALRAAQKYSLANVYEKEAPGEGLGTLHSLIDESTLPYTSAATWEQPAAVYQAAVGQPDLEGLVFDDYARAQQQTETFALLVSAIDMTVPAPQPLGFAPSHKLAITYPAVDAKIYTAKCFIMGTSDPAQPLTMNGAEVTRAGTTGAFGVLVDVVQGDNVFVFAQGTTQVEYTIVQPAPSGGGSGGIKHDDTKSVPVGSYVQVAHWIASLLYDPSGDNKISETAREGGIGRVVDCVETTRNGKTTWAYQLASGDYILAYNTNFLGTDVPRASFTGATAQVNGREETLTFAGSGTPMAYGELEGNDLVLHFYDTDLAPDFAVTGSGLVRSAITSTLENGGVELRLQFAQPPHGFSVEYADGTIQLLLKAVPTRSTAQFGKPLAGVSVLLDPGHGKDDTGAMGVAGREAPQEKDVNLAVSMSAKYRLEQLGATVHTIRSDDSFLTLIERNQKITELKPDFFISIHHNSVELTVDANGTGGTECYYFYDTGKQLAETLVQNVVAATDRADRTAKWGYYYVARNTLCPAVLLECGFMVNPAEYENVTDDAVILREGDAIARAVLAQVK